MCISDLFNVSEVSNYGDMSRLELTDASFHESAEYGVFPDAPKG